MKCHDKAMKATDGKPLANMAALLASNQSKHGPIREGHCTVCHDPHAGKQFRLLPEKYPEQFYAPFSLDLYKLCFQCHTPDMVLKKNGAGVTQFRDGNVNLHTLHVNQEKGRTCRACHEVHASQRSAHVRESVPFGTSNWLLEINYKSAEDGGSCAPGCHAPKKYTRPMAALPPPKTSMPVPSPTAVSNPPSAPPSAPALTPPVSAITPPVREPSR